MRKLFLSAVLFLMTMTMMGQEKGKLLDGVVINRAMYQQQLDTVVGMFRAYENEVVATFVGEHKDRSFTLKNAYVRPYTEVQPDGTVYEGYQAYMDDGAKLILIPDIGVMIKPVVGDHVFYFKDELLRQ